MQIERPNCPTCGEPATSVLESIFGLALISQNPDENGTVFTYAGQTDVNWDSQTSVLDGEGNATLGCGEHEWQSKVWPDPED